MLANYVKRAFRAVGLEVQWLRAANTGEAVLRNLLNQSDADVLLDVGANLGQFAEEVRSVGFRRRIISFEALPDVHAQLARRAIGDAHWTVAPCMALGSERSVVEMNVAGNVASSSLLPMHRTHVEAAPESAYVRTQTVQVTRLDEICAGLLPAAGSVYLKIDTQGYEREVLLGATGIMDRVVVLQLELSLVPLYENGPLFTEMLHFADSLGFELFNVIPAFKDRRSGRLLQVDGFFVRKGGAPTS